MSVGYPEKTLLEAYRIMRSIRGFEERIVVEFERGNIPGFVHVYDGQEAVATAVCMHLTERDYIGSTHRGHGHCIAKGCDIGGMMKEIMARSTGLCHGKGGSMHIADISKGMLGANAIVGGAAPLCLGAALSAKTLGTRNVSVSFTGDGGSNQGTVFESLNLAVVLKLPTIFIFENNGYGEFTSAQYSVGSGDIAGRAAGFGMPAEKVDGCDFFSMFEVAGKAIDRARDGLGPTAIEAVVERFHGHFVGDAQVYRNKEELQALRNERDCLKIFRERVEAEGWLHLSQLDAIDENVDTLIEKSVEEALAAPHPRPGDLLTDVYGAY